MTDQIKLLIGVMIILVIPLFMGWLIMQEQANNDKVGKQSNGDTTMEGTSPVWGVDSAYPADENLYACVADNYGTPEVWGRYLGNIEDVSVALSQDEVDFLHNKDVKVLVIYNLIEDATGYDHGINHAKQAVEAAEQLKVPEGVALFADIEPSFAVDTNFMKGWQQTLQSSAYEPGVYGVFDKNSDILNAFKAMTTEGQKNTIVWTAYPQQDPSTKKQAPDYAAQGPDQAKVYGWQYSIETKRCSNDVNLFKKDMFDYLW